MNWLNKIFKLRENADKEAVKPFLDHMEDLRWTLIKMGSTLFAGMVVAFIFRKPLFAIMLEPLKAITDEPSKVLQMTEVAASIMVSLTLAFYAGIVGTFPFLFYFLLEFVLPALTRKEQRFVLPGIGVGFVLFSAGVWACYSLILPPTLKWLFFDAANLGVQAHWMVRDYFSFVTRICIGFGLLCELPVVMTVLALLGMISFDWLKQTRPYAIIIILILAAFIAPTPDPVTFLMLGAPIVALYEICIWIVYFIDRKRRKKEAEQREREDREAAEWRQKKWEEQQRAEKEGHESPHTED
jgi:sec-independent protein translocase protein TatC